MKRRQHTIGPSVPEALCRFVPSEWATAEDPFRAWCKARLEFAMEHDDTPIGDPVDVMREHVKVKRRMLARGEL